MAKKSRMLIYSLKLLLKLPSNLSLRDSEQPFQARVDAIFEQKITLNISIYRYPLSKPCNSSPAGFIIHKSMVLE